MQQLQKEIEGKEKQRMKRIKIVSLEVVKESALPYPYEKRKITCPADVVDIARQFIGNKDREHLAVMCLSTKNEVQCLSVVSIGDLNSAIATPREIFKLAVLSNSASIVLFHNHPSGDPIASRQDLDVTKRIKEAGELLGIELLDHVIITPNDYYSIKEKGHM
jgi:DNA repair protein RadC